MIILELPAFSARRRATKPACGQFVTFVVGALTCCLKAFLDTAAQSDPTYAGERVARLAGLLGRELGLTYHQLDTLRYACLLHDIGKLGVRPEVIAKPVALSALEIDEVRLHR